MIFIGRSGDKYLFSLDEKGVIVDDSKNLITDIGPKEALVASLEWDPEVDSPTPISVELASAALTSLDIKVLSDNERLYTIPAAIALEAKRGLNWHKEFSRGGTVVGLNTAKILASGGQININKIRHIAKYFPRHDKNISSSEFSLAYEDAPSNNRISWALWGGNSARSWATTIINRDNKARQKDAITASFDYVMSQYDSPDQAQLDPFQQAEDLPIDAAPQFAIRVRLDGTGIDRLYMINPDGACFVWDDAMWEDLGNVNHDFDTYDRSLDDPSDKVEKLHIPVDTDTAVIVSAYLDSNPFSPVSIEDVNPQEYKMYVDEMDDIDWRQVESVYRDPSMLAAGEVPAPASRDGNYTPEERSKNAGAQVRDKVGKFAKQGGTVVVGGNPKYKGVITAIDQAAGTVKLKLANGSLLDVPAALTEDASTFAPVPNAPVGASGNTDITRGILSAPAVVVNASVAKLPAKLPVLTSSQINTVVADYPLWAADRRQNLVGDETLDNAYDDKDLQNYLYGKVTNSDGSTSPASSGWYKPDPNDKSLTEIKSSSMSKPDWMTPNTTFGMIASAPGTQITPATSDVPPLYAAIVSADDPQAVMELVALVPASTTSPEATTYRRKTGKWVLDNSILTDLRSPTPPPVVLLDNATLKTVLTQVDASLVASSYRSDRIITSLVAAGGLDRNRGNAEKLRRYWLYGEGAAKIMWRTPGDWTRCVRHLSKFMGPRAKGYCALRHKEATGMWTGDKAHEQHGGLSKTGRKLFSTDYLVPEAAIIATAELKVAADQVRTRVNGAPAAVANTEAHGAEFIIPLVIPEELESGDGRSFVKGSITMRELPLPLLWQIKTADGHSGSVVVGKILSMERTTQGIGNARGFFDTGVAGREAQRMVSGKFIRGISADMDMFEADEEDKSNEIGSDEKIGGGKMIIRKARIMAATLVAKPAFQECEIYIVGENPTDQEDPDMISDGVYVDGVNAQDASALVACGLVAGAIPVVPPRSWFDDPKLTKPSALTVDDEGRVFGHIAAWHVDHIGMAFGTKPPRSRSKYAYFHTGVVRTDDGTDVPVGQLTLAGGHASLEASASEAVRHYDDTASAIADVHAGEDAFGIWVSGALRPGSTPEQIRSLRASAPSGDWRPIRGGLELVAVLQVNTPGFPIARARVASGQVMALVAAGASTLAQLKYDPIAELNARLDNLEAPIVSRAAEVKNRVSAITMSIKAQELSNKVRDARDTDSFYMLQTITDDDSDLAVISRESRVKLAEQGRALPNGSFPIRNSGDLRNAIQAYGRAKPGERGDVRRHIMKMARRLDQTQLIPRAWKESGKFDLEMSAIELHERVFGTSGTSKEAISAAGVADSPDGPVDPGIDPGPPEEKSTDVKDLTPGDKVGLTEDEIKILEQEIRDKRHAISERVKYTPDNQPRDTTGKFRQVLARLKVDLGDVGSQEAVKKIEETQKLDEAGNYGQAVKSAGDLIDIVDRLDTGALDNKSIDNVRSSARELGKVIANLPFAFGQDAQKIRYSDVPPVLKNLIEDMITRVEAKIGPKDGAIATHDIKNFMSGGDYYSQSEISSQMAKLLRLLT